MGKSVRLANGAPSGEENRYRRLLDAITDYAIYMLDEGGVVTSWNTGAQRVKGYKPDEILGHHFERFYTPEDRATELPRRALAQAAQTGRFEQEGWRLRKDGTRFWAHVVIDPIRDLDGRVSGFAKVTRDLTERRAAEESLRQSEEQFRLLVQGVADYAIYMLDTSGRVASWNAGAQRFKGYAAGEIVGEHFSRFYTDEDRAAGLPAEALRIAKAEGRFEREGWRVRKDGGRLWAHVVIDPIHNDDGALIGFAKITRDITERMESQKKLEAAQQTLFQAQKLESIGQLTGGMAHDFNNLLTAISGSLELLKKYLPSDRRAQGLLENAMLGAHRGASLTQRMLAFARRQDLQMQAVDVAALVSGMRGLIERSIGPSFAIDVQIAPGLPPAHSDLNQLESALLNLVVNARDAMTDGGTIDIAAAVESLVKSERGDLPVGTYVVLSVADHGCGMTPEVLSKALEPFYTTKGVGKGTGLGLPMVHGLAAQSGGKLTLASEAGVGTKVEIWLPVSPDAVIFAQEPQPSTLPVLQPMTILVVDDDKLVLRNTTAMLEDQGHRVIEAASGAQAVELLVRYPDIQLVVSDQAMPGMTGLELAQVAKAYRPKLPFLIATGFAEMGADDGLAYPRLQKPFSQRQLLRAVTNAAGPAREAS